MRLPFSPLNKLFWPVLCATGATLAFSSSSGGAFAMFTAQHPEPAQSILSAERPSVPASPTVAALAVRENAVVTETGTQSPIRFENKLFAMPLPQNLTPRQRQTALELMREAEPRLSVMHTQLRTTLEELHNLSFAADTPPDARANLGRRLVKLRNDITLEMRRLSLLMEKEAGFNPGWGASGCEYSADMPIPPCERFE